MRNNHLTSPSTYNPVTKSDASNHHHGKKRMSLFLVIAAAFLTTSLSVSTIITIDAQAYSPSTAHAGSISNSSNNNSTSIKTEAIQMGVCVVGVESPCNGDTNSVK